MSNCRVRSASKYALAGAAYSAIHIALKFFRSADDDFDNSDVASGGLGTMYETHFQLRQRPFPATPDASRYYPATSHERAIARLMGGLSDGEGVLLLTGAPGTGKTLLCHCLIERLGPQTNIVFLTNSHAGGRAGLLQAILYDLSLPYEGRGEQEMRLALTEHLLQNYEQGGGTILIVDEAQHLTPDLLEELRLLGNLEARSGKALQVVLVGQPALLETLHLSELTALRQRLAVRADVEPLALQEAADYLLHHVRIAGGRPERLFADEALELLSRQTQGVPRLLNQAAHQALNLAAEAGAACVDAEAALEALILLDLAESSDRDDSDTTQNDAGEESMAVADDEGDCRLMMLASARGE